MINLVLVLSLSYLVGSIPTSIIVSKWGYGFDIRTKGSGNAGGTNVFRVLGWKSGLFVMLVDCGKGILATTVVAPLYWSSWLPASTISALDDYTIIQMVCGGAAMVGHVWTVFAGFKGGKGAATAAGMLVGLAPTEFAVSGSVFFLVMILSRYVSVGSMAGGTAFPISLLIRHNLLAHEVPGYKTLIFFSIGVAVLLIFSHRANIKRLIKGTENRISRFSKSKNSQPQES